MKWSSRRCLKLKVLEKMDEDLKEHVGMGNLETVANGTEGKFEV